MKILQVHSLPLKEVIADLAAALSTTFTQDCGEYAVEIPAEWGKGIIKGVNFEGGLGQLIYNCVFHTDLQISFTVNNTHPLKFLYCLEGVVLHHFEKDRQKHELVRYQNIIVASKGHNGHVLSFKKGVHTEIYSLEIDRQVFKRKMACELKYTKPYIEEVFDDVSANTSFYYNGLYSLVLAEIFDEMKSASYDPFIWKLFMESQSYRMLANQLIQLNDDLGGHSEKRILRKAEVNSIKEAVEIIKLELDNLGSINSIAQRVGLSPKKIQAGFQHLYGKTTNEYIQAIRLTLAKELLITTDDTIQEIKNKVGFSSHSYFTELFKKMYQMTPTQFRMIYKDEIKTPPTAE